jgi:PIN domain nuclease of toxin-antitoxin system
MTTRNVTEAKAQLSSLLVAATELISSDDDRAFVSAISVWETAIKLALKKFIRL